MSMGMMLSSHRVGKAAAWMGAVLAGLLAVYIEFIFMYGVGMSIDKGELEWAAVGIARGIVPIVCAAIAWNRARSLPSPQRALIACGLAVIAGHLLFVVSFFVGMVWT